MVLSIPYKVVVMVIFEPGLPVLYQGRGFTRKNCDAMIKLQCLLGIHFNELKFTDNNVGLKYVQIICNAVQES